MSGLRVFLSSTATDLIEYRRIADDTLLAPAAAVGGHGALRCATGHAGGRVRTLGRVVRLGGVHRRAPLWLRARSGPRQHHTARSRGGTPRGQTGVCVDRRRQASLDRGQGAGPADAARRAGRSGEGAGSHRSDQGAARLQGLAASRFVTDSFTTADDLGRKIATTLANVAGATRRRPAAARRPHSPAPELRIVHALQPAPHFNGRDDSSGDALGVGRRPASPDRVHALVAAAAPARPPSPNR